MEPGHSLSNVLPWHTKCKTGEDALRPFTHALKLYNLTLGERIWNPLQSDFFGLSIMILQSPLGTIFLKALVTSLL